MFYTYVIKNEKGKIYIGQTEDLEKRLLRHNLQLKSKARSYTKINRGKWLLVYKEACRSRVEAIKREKFLKSHIGRNWLRKILAR